MPASATISRTEMTLPPAPQTLNQLLGSWRKEIQGYYDLMEKFDKQEIRLTLMQLAAFCARADSIRNQVIRSSNDEAKAFRIQQVDPFIAATERQFKIWSRIGSLIDAEWKMSGASV